MNGPSARPIITKPGVYDLPLATYLADPMPEPSASAGILQKLINLSPLHAWLAHPRLGGKAKAYQREAALGTVVHALLLGKGGEYVVIDPRDHPAKSTGAIPTGWNNQSIRDARDAVVAAGKTPILPKDMEIAEAMIEAARKQLRRHELGNIFERPGKAEQTLAWKEGGLWCRAAVDWLPDDLSSLVNIKTTACVHPESFKRRAFQNAYDLSCAHYEAGAAAVFQREIQEIFVAIETEPPHLLAVYCLNGTAREYARRKRQAALKLWGTCLTANHWPGYARRVYELDMPGYQLFRQEEDEVSGAWSPEMLKWMNDFYQIGEAAE